MKPDKPVGIVGYGAYIPLHRLSIDEISEVWKKGQDRDVLPVKQKSVPGPDEDTVTMSIEAAQNALLRAGISPEDVQAVWVGSESHPYAVKPSSTVVAQSLGITPNTTGADFEFACKAGTEALQAALGFSASGMAKYTLAVAMDTAQARPGDALEYTAAAGGAAFVIGPASESVAILEGSYSYVTDTPDFFRKAYQKYPEHGNRFTGEPAYFHHIVAAVTTLLNELQLKPEDFSAAVFHQPNSKFPQKVAKELGFSRKQLESGLLAPYIGNSYAGSSPLGFTALLDNAKPGDRLLLASFGSGAGSDAFSFVVTDKIEGVKLLAPTTQNYLNRSNSVDYPTYLRWRKKIELY